MSQIKGKQIKDNSLDLEKIKGGSKILPNTATFGTDKTKSEITDSREFTTKDYVDDAINGATVEVDNGLVNTNGTIGLGGSLIKNTTIDGAYNLNINNVNNFNVYSNINLKTKYLTTNSGFDGYTVFATALLSDGRVLVGGEFTTYNGNSVPNNLVCLNADLTLDTTFNTGGSGFNGNQISVILVQSDGKILVGGNFTTYNGVDCPDKLVRLNSDGTLDTSFNTSGSGFNSTGDVYALSFQSDGQLLVGGNFTTYNGVDCPDKLVRLNSDGTLDTSFNTGGSGFDDTNSYLIYSISLQSDGKIIIGSDVLTSFNGSAYNGGGITRLNTDGTIDTSFNSSDIGFDAAVRNVLVLSDDTILVGGDFTTYNGIDCPNGITHLNSDGTIDTSFNNGGTGFAYYGASSIVVQNDGKIIVTAPFSNTYNDNPCPNGVFRLNSDGSLDTTFNTNGVGFDGYVYCIAIQADGLMLVGGGFSTYNGVDCSDRFVRLNYDGSWGEFLSVSLSGSGALRYDDDYSNQYVDRSLVDKAYVDANTNIDLSYIQVDSFYLESSAGAYFQVPGAAYFDTNQVYLAGASSVGIETPSTNIFTDNFGLYINPADAQTVIINETDFIVKAPNSILYDGDYSAIYTDRSLVDKAYVDSVVSSASLNNLNTIKVTGSGISGTSGIVSYLGTITFPANAITDAEVFVNGVKIEIPLDAYFGTSGNSKPQIGQTMYFDLTSLGYDIEAADRIQITYLT